MSDFAPPRWNSLPLRIEQLAIAAAIMLVAAIGATDLRAQVIEGRVTNAATGRPIEGASVTLARLGDSTARYSIATDSDGRFAVPAAAGEYAGTVRKIGFLAVELTVTFDGQTTARRQVEMSAIPRLLDTVHARAGRSRLTSGSTWFAEHSRQGKGFFTSGNEILLTKLDACDYLGQVPGLALQAVSPPRGEPALRCYDGRYVVATASRCLRTIVDRTQTIVEVDSASFQVRSQDRERAALRERDERRLAARGRARRRDSIFPDTMPSHLPLIRVAGIEVFRNRSELPRDMSIPIPREDDPDRMRRCGYMLVWTWPAW